MFRNDKPVSSNFNMSHNFIAIISLTAGQVDWLIIDLAQSRFCGIPGDKTCTREVAKRWIKYKDPGGSLFQHVGKFSSLEGKVQKLVDKSFKKPKIIAHRNPPATLETNLRVYDKHTPQKLYIEGTDFFWSREPKKDDYFTIKFKSPIELSSYLFKTGNANSPGDMFPEDAVIEVRPDKYTDAMNILDKGPDNYLIVGHFNKMGEAIGQISTEFGKIQSIRIRCLTGSKKWVLLREVHLVPRR